MSLVHVNKHNASYEKCYQWIGMEVGLISTLIHSVFSGLVSTYALFHRPGLKFLLISIVSSSSSPLTMMNQQSAA